MSTARVKLCVSDVPGSSGRTVEPAPDRASMITYASLLHESGDWACFSKLVTYQRVAGYLSHSSPMLRHRYTRKCSHCLSPPFSMGIGRQLGTFHSCKPTDEGSGAPFIGHVDQLGLLQVAQRRLNHPHTSSPCNHNVSNAHASDLAVESAYTPIWVLSSALG